MKFYKIFSAIFATIFIVGTLSISGCSIFGNNSNNNTNNNSNGGGQQEEEPLPDFAGGNGTENDPYVISAAYQWKNINKFLSSYFVVDSDLNMDIGEISPVGSQQKPFTGSLDAQNHIIHDAKISNKSISGLFGVISGGTVKNVLFKNSTVMVDGTENSHCLGAIAGHIKLGGKIENCHSDNITCRYEFQLGLPRLGGVVGIVSSASEVIYCSSTNLNIKGISSGLIYTPEYIFGGVIGRMEGGKVDMCYSTGYFDAKSDMGYSATSRLIGGVIGVIVGGSVSNVYSQITLKDASEFTGSVIYNYSGGSVNFGLSFCEFTRSVNKICYYNENKNDTATLKYFNSTTIENSNDILENDENWKNNPYWKAGKLHPELIGYEEYLQLSSEV